MRYKHRPTTIEAFCWTGDEQQAEPPVWVVEAINEGRIFFHAAGTDDIQVVVMTPEGEHVGRPGCWIAKGVADELYIIQPDLFGQLYILDDEADEDWFQKADLKYNQHPVARCMGPWPQCGHGDQCTANPEYQRWAKQYLREQANV